MSYYNGISHLINKNVSQSDKSEIIFETDVIDYFNNIENSQKKLKFLEPKVVVKRGRKPKSKI